MKLICNSKVFFKHFLRKKPFASKYTIMNV